MNIWYLVQTFWVCENSALVCVIESTGSMITFYIENIRDIATIILKNFEILFVQVLQIKLFNDFNPPNDRAFSSVIKEITNVKVLSWIQFIFDKLYLVWHTYHCHLLWSSISRLLQEMRCRKACVGICIRMKLIIRRLNIVLIFRIRIVRFIVMTVRVVVFEIISVFSDVSAELVVFSVLQLIEDYSVPWTRINRFTPVIR